MRLALGGEPASFEREVRIGAEIRCLKFQYTPDIDAQGKTLEFYTMGIDVTEAKTTQMRLSALAEFDTLTGLANRARMQAWLDAACPRETGSYGCGLLVFGH